MANVFNIWLGVSDEARTEYKARREQGDAYAGPMDDKTFKILNRINDLDVVERFFKTPTIGGKVRHLFSIYTETDSNPAAVQAALDYLEQEWPTHFVVAGVWHMDGRQAGTQVDEQGVITGTPVYPIPPQLIQFMPDIVDEQGNTSAPTEITDVNLLLGQSPRNFD